MGWRRCRGIGEGADGLCFVVVRVRRLARGETVCGYFAGVVRISGGHLWVGGCRAISGRSPTRRKAYSSVASTQHSGRSPRLRFVPTSVLAAFHGSSAGRGLFDCGLIDIRQWPTRRVLELDDLTAMLVPCRGKNVGHAQPLFSRLRLRSFMPKLAGRYAYRAAKSTREMRWIRKARALTNLGRRQAREETRFKHPGRHGDTRGHENGTEGLIAGRQMAM